MAIDTLPEDFVVDELPDGFQLDDSSSAKEVNPTNRIPLAKDASNYTGNPYINAASDTASIILNNLADTGDATLDLLKQVKDHPVLSTKTVIGGIANSIFHPIITGKAMGKDLIDKITNAPNKPIDALLTMGSDALLAQGAANLVKSGVKLAPETYSKIKTVMPKAYNDSLVSNTVNSIGDKVTGALKPVQEKYKLLTTPFVEKPIDGETFQKALSIAPKEMRSDLIEKYGTSILDDKGRPQTNLGKLQAMELGLKEDIMQPKYGATINASSYDLAKATKQLKDIRLSQYPDDVRNSILELDKKFGPLISASKEILPKVSNQAGVANTKAVFNWFNDASNAGKRDYLVSDLKKLGIDLKPEVNLIKGWVSRQKQKKFLKNIGGIAAEGTIIGKVLRGGH